MTPLLSMRRIPLLFRSTTATLPVRSTATAMGFIVALSAGPPSPVLPNTPVPAIVLMFPSGRDLANAIAVEIADIEIVENVHRNPVWLPD